MCDHVSHLTQFLVILPCNIDQQLGHILSTAQSQVVQLKILVQRQTNGNKVNWNTNKRQTNNTHTHTHFCAENSLPREPNAKQKQLLVSIDKEKHWYPKWSMVFLVHHLPELIHAWQGKSKDQNFLKWCFCYNRNFAETARTPVEQNKIQTNQFRVSS